MKTLDRLATCLPMHSATIAYDRSLPQCSAIAKAFSELVAQELQQSKQKFPDTNIL